MDENQTVRVDRALPKKFQTNDKGLRKTIAYRAIFLQLHLLNQLSHK